jgi:hypothetical protein
MLELKIEALMLERRKLILTSATLIIVGWVEPILGDVGFLRLRRTNRYLVSSIAQCETQQWPI